MKVVRATTDYGVYYTINLPKLELFYNTGFPEGRYKPLSGN
eukprot:gene9447-19626_t